MLELTDLTFDEIVTGSEKPVVIDFYADWCGPCKMIAPILQELSDELSDSIEFAKIDTDSNLDTARKFNIRSIPAVLVFNNGELVKEIIGAKSKDGYLAEFSELDILPFEAYVEELHPGDFDG